MKLEPTSRNIPRKLYKYRSPIVFLLVPGLDRELLSRAWPRGAAPLRSSAPHVSRTGGHAARPPMLAAG